MKKIKFKINNWLWKQQIKLGVETLQSEQEHLIKGKQLVQGQIKKINRKENQTNIERW